MKKLSKKQAMHEVLHLFDDAKELAGSDLEESNKRVKKARRIAMKARLRLPKEIKRRFCKKCGTVFIPGKNYRVRSKNKKIIYTCLTCKHIFRFPTIEKRKI